MRDSREPQTEGSVSRLARAGRRLRPTRRLWAGSLALLLPLVLVLVAFLAPIGQAKERSPEREAARNTRLAERLQRAEERKAQREMQERARRERSERAKTKEEERENGVVKISCTQVSWTFRGFPDLPGNTVTEKLTIGHLPATLRTFTFDGTTGTDVVAINAPPGPGGAGYKIDAWGKWTTNGFHGAFDIHAKVTCPAAPALAIEKLQQIAGAGGSYTSTPVTGQVGQTVDYEIVVRNTGNVPLSLGNFSDPRCDEETISGGPGVAELAAGASSTYLCSHLLGTADRTSGRYLNAVTLTATPPEGEGSPISETSNTVEVQVPPVTQPHKEEKTSSTTTTTPPPTVSASTLGSITTQPPRSGVLAFSAASVPRLSGPQGCVRRGFRVTIKSAGVASVTFYLDGHKLKRLTAHSARKGQLSIVIDPSKLRVGAHRLLAKITMVKAPGAARAVTASRRMIVLRCASAALTPKFTG
jgi:hypothetical protein